jgi:hypothetical protein
MKKQIRTIIIALVLGTITANAQGVMANGLTHKKASVNATSELTNFVNKKAKKISKRNIEELNKYTEIVNLYHTSNVDFYNLSEADRKEFLAASKILSEQLSGLRKSQAKVLASKINLNKSVFEFIWSSKNNHISVDESIEIPTMVSEVTAL